MQNKKWLSIILVILFFNFNWLTLNFDQEIISNRSSKNEFKGNFSEKLSIQEALKLISYPNLSPYSLTNTTIAIIDSGVNNSLITNQWVNENEIINDLDDDNNGYIDDYLGWDFILDKPISKGNSALVGFSDHGTFIGNIIQQMNPSVRIMNIRVLDENNSNPNFEDFAKAILYAISFPDVKVIQFSIEFTPYWLINYPEILRWAFTKAYLQNVTIVSVAGNGGKNSLSDPGNWPETISVASVEKKGDAWIQASYSNSGDNLDISAPGTNIESIGMNSEMLILSGTSFSSAFIGGAVSLLQSIANNKLDPEQIRKLLQYSSESLGTCSKYGAGLINISKLLDNTRNFQEKDNISLKCDPTYEIPST
ncbi:MAG: S8 family serine peptidase, partial [Candidatus Heimdallarchaeota archaeon]